MGGFSRQGKGGYSRSLEREDSHAEGLRSTLPGAEVRGDLCDRRVEFQAEGHCKCLGRQEQGAQEAREKVTMKREGLDG